MRVWIVAVVAALAVGGIVAGVACPEPPLQSLGGKPDGGECTAHCPAPPPRPVGRKPAPNPIPAENAKTGDWDWRAGGSAHNGEVDMYLDADSVAAGETVGVKVSADKALEVTAEIYRIGWYGGAGARKVWTGGPYKVGPQASCPLDEQTGLVECDWKDTFTFVADPDWTPGMFVVKVVRPDGIKRFSPLVMRDARRAEILFTPNFTTYQAYNTWGGESLYFDGSGKMPAGRAHLVSFNRPYNAVDGLGKTFNLDLALVGLLEKHGYDVTYATQLDFVRFDDLLEGIGAFVHGGQDEYWTAKERAQVDAALARGELSLAYFGGNGGYWRIRLLSDKHGTPYRTIACYKSEPEADPQPYSTVRFRDEPSALPENNLFGVMYEGYQTVPFPLAVGDPGHWLFEGTGLARGDLLQGMVGFEYDRAFPSLPGYPSGVKTVMTSPVVSAEGYPSYTNVVERTLPSGRLVFSAGTIWWPIALGPDPELEDPRVERMTLNVLERALAHRRPARTLAPVTGGGPQVPAPEAAWAKSVGFFAGTAGRAGYRDGPAHQALFHGPTGLAATPQGNLIVADTGNSRLRWVGLDAQRTVSTLAGNGDLGYRDGPAAQAMFRMPMDVAVGPGGEIYVADSDNHAIRRLDKAGTGWTVSTVAGKGFSAGYRDGVGEAALFNRPTSLEVDAQGNVFVADQGNNRIRMIKAGTREVVTIAGTGAWGTEDAARGKDASFAVPSALTVGAGGEIYVLDGGSQLIRRIRRAAGWPVDTVAGDRNAWFGFQDGPADQMRARAQLGLEVGLGGELFFADTANFRIRKVILGATPAQSRVYTIAGSGKVGTRLGTGADSDIVAPTGLAEGPNANLYVSDSYNHAIREIVR